MNELREPPNIGARLASELFLSGITTADQLMNAGSLNAAACLQAHGFPVCSNNFYALEGAIRGLRWHRILSEERSTLWLGFSEREQHLQD
ncbi:TfoX/Sxy family DNA transformation protein [Candidatus Bipolaricaulota bacterium]|nr:TfoX/Sxy family DNA transformation protein [Candidatus Bipolaricaulota bacterium]